MARNAGCHQDLLLALGILAFAGLRHLVRILCAVDRSPRHLFPGTVDQMMRLRGSAEIAAIKPAGPWTGRALELNDRDHSPREENHLVGLARWRPVSNRPIRTAPRRPSPTPAKPPSGGVAPGCRLSRGDLDGAIAAVDQAIALNPRGGLYRSGIVFIGCETGSRLRRHREGQAH